MHQKIIVQRLEAGGGIKCARKTCSRNKLEKFKKNYFIKEKVEIKIRIKQKGITE